MKREILINPRGTDFVPACEGCGHPPHGLFCDARTEVSAAIDKFIADVKEEATRLYRHDKMDGITLQNYTEEAMRSVAKTFGGGE